MSAVFCHLSTALLRSGSEIRISRMEEKMKPTCKGTGMVVLGLLVLLAAGLAAAPETQAQVFSYRKPITIDRNQVGVSGTSTTTLSNYPMLYSVTDQDLRTTANGGKVQNANGWDIIFRAFDADNPGANICGAGVAVCTLDHEIEKYVATTGQLIAWTRIPVLNTISASSNTVIYIYYGNSSITSSTENPTGVWDTNFQAVWHMNQNPSTAASTDCAGGAGTKELCDSTSNNLDGDSIGTMTAGDLVAAKVGDGIDFDGTDDAIQIPSFTLGTSFTLENWFKANNLGAGVYHGHMSNNNAFGNAGHRWLGTDGTNNTWDAASTETSCTTGGLATGTWYHQVVTYDTTNLRCYQDGTLVLTTPFSYSAVTSTFGLAYTRATATEYFNGTLDEARVSNMARSADWIKTEYNNLSNPGGFAVTSAGLVAHWKLDDGAGTSAADASGNGYTGTLVNGPVWTTGTINGALDFDGSNDYVNLPNVPSVVAPYSVSLWFYPQVLPGGSQQVLLSLKGSNVYPRFELYSNNELLIYAGAEKYRYGARVFSAGDLNKWWHVVFVIDSSSSLTGWKIYLNGVDDSGTTGANSGTYFDPSSPGKMGSSDGSSLFFNGLIDQVRIYNRALSTAEVTSLYNEGGFYTVATEEGPNVPSLVRFTKASALAYDGVQNRVVQLQWRTSYEVDHLGFHVYREQNGERLQVTPALIAGSALKARAGTVLTAGQSYSWWDVLPAGSGPLAYWLEEIDLHGQRIWHGPVAVESAKGHRLAAEPERVRSVLLTRMGRGKASVTALPWYGTRPALLAPVTPTPEQLAVQWRLAAGRAVKLGVQAEGWYRVSQADLVAAGFDARVNPRYLQLFADGVEVPLLVLGEQDGRFDPSDAIEFYGLGLDTPWTDTRTYWLVAESREGQRVSWAPSRPAAAVAPLSFPSTLEWRPRNIYFAALLRSEEHTSELQSHVNLVCRLLL